MATEAAPHALQVDPAFAPREAWGPINDSCALARSLAVVSTRTAFLVLREAFYGATRFEQFAERGEISEPVASARLRELTDEGLFERVPYREPGQRTRYEYHLTDKAVDLFPALMALWEWGNRWLVPDGSRIRFVHSDCGAPVHAEVICEHGHPLAPEDVTIAASPRQRARRV